MAATDPLPGPPPRPARPLPPPVSMVGSEAEDQEIWLLSYSDLVTLLFACFVMLLAITVMKDQLPKAPPPPPPPQSLAQSVEAAPEASLPGQPAPTTPPTPSPPSSRPVLEPDQVAIEAPERVLERWNQALRRYGLADAVRVTLDGTRVSLEIAENILFAPGQADLTGEGRKLLGRLGPVLPATGSAVTVEGHTDSQPITTARFPSNWELSAARAAAVGRALLDLGLPPARLMVAGRADTRPLADNAREDGRARNRRVNILLEP